MSNSAAHTLAGLATRLDAGETTSVDLARQCVRRIGRLDRKGPALGAVMAINPRAARAARLLDAERQMAGPRGPLHGVPILIKDNIETADPLPTTAGSLALRGNVTGRDAPVIERLRRAGALILGKANLSEWANFRSAHSISGWSALGGQGRNAIDPTRSPAGSSSGSATAVAAGMAAAAVGTETDGSIVAPAAVHGLVGLKPTVGLVSRRHIVPISHSQDTAGPIARWVEDAAILLSAMAGSDPGDPTTAPADARRSDYAATLGDFPLEGVRIGVLRFCAGFHPGTDAAFAAALEIMVRAGAVLVEIAEGPDRRALAKAEELVLLSDFRSDIDAYLATTEHRDVTTRSLADLIAFNADHAGEELSLFGQEMFIAAQGAPGQGSDAYLAALETGRRLAGPEGLDRMFGERGVTLVVAPTMGPAWLIDPILKDHYPGGRATTLPAVAGYPHLTVPMGVVGGLPVGLSFIGPAWSEASVLGLGHAFERARAGGEA